MIKELIDMHLAAHYGLHRVVSIDENHTTDTRFDLKDENGAVVVPFGNGYASFVNETHCDVAVLNYEGYINKYVGTRFHTGRAKCDCILENGQGSTIMQ